jgi:hypothetical protein
VSASGVAVGFTATVNVRMNLARSSKTSRQRRLGGRRYRVHEDHDDLRRADAPESSESRPRLLGAALAMRYAGKT